MINITEKSKCSGCHSCMNACPQNCIKMLQDEEGFWYPKVDLEKCIACGVCDKVCPIINEKKVKNIPVAYAAYSKDEKIRLDSSSGGLFTEIAQKIIRNGGVVFGACFNEKFEVEHRCISDIENISKLRGSKYTQSKIGNSYKQVKRFLDEGTLVLFSGTPCQVSGLKAYLRKEYSNLYCQDIVCHGVPSPKVWTSYVKYREQCAGAHVKKINFRDKCAGWKNFSLAFEFVDNTEYIKTLKEDLFLKAFLKNVCLRPSCYNCAFKTIHRESDFSLADFWGIGSIMPEMDDDKGTSLVILNSDKGKILFESVKENIICSETELNEAIKHNSAMTESVQSNPMRQKFFNDVDKLSFDVLIRKYCEDSFFVKLKRKNAKVVGTAKKILKIIIKAVYGAIYKVKR